jgi:DNA-binding NarL/FixJ family response regulator
MSEIARAMFLSRRTVQTYIPHILAELDAKSAIKNHVRRKASSDDHCSLPGPGDALEG